MSHSRRQRNAAPASQITDRGAVWSTCVQSVEWLEISREAWLGDEVRGILWPVLGLSRGATVVDVGCGGGALTRTLARWLGPGCTVYGIDRDREFLAHACRRARTEHLQRRIRYLEGDALALPLPAAAADAVTSFTVASHIPDTKRFMREKMRVCRPGGRVSIMEVDPARGLVSTPKRSCEPTQRERALWKPLEQAYRRRIHRPLGVGAVKIELAKMPRLFEELGLADLMVDAFAPVWAPDDARVSREREQRYLLAQEDWLLAQVDRCAQLLSRPLPPGHLAALRRCIRARYGRYQRRLAAGVRTWNLSVKMIWVVSGRVPEGISRRSRSPHRS